LRHAQTPVAVAGNPSGIPAAVPDGGRKFGTQFPLSGVAVEKLFLAKFAKMKLRQDAL
jgi:hypothetical protein